jgi:PhnB protein
MPSPVKPIPDGYHTITPYLFISNAAKALDFYKQAFDAKELIRMADPGGRIMHAEIQIGDSRLMLAEECPQMGSRSASSLNGSPVCLSLYVEDADAVTQRAEKAGAKILRPIQDQFYGDRSAMLSDPFGHLWNISTHKEDVSEDEIKRRAAALFQNSQNSQNNSPS